MKKEFKVPPSLRSLPAHPEWEMPLVDRSMLNQPFTYLTHGNQSTVFVSEDGRYVLKLFRYNRTCFPLLHALKSIARKKPKNDLFTKANKTFQATHIACTKAQNFTQAIYCHLNLTKNELPTVTLIADRTYHLPLDSYRFVIQKKADGFKETLLQARLDPKTMQKLISSWVHLIEERSTLGIRNSDPNLGPNFGFIDGEAVEIDFGNYRNAKQTPEEIANYFNRFEEFLIKNAPEYVSYFRECFQKRDR